jgi:thioredoxin 2
LVRDAVSDDRILTLRCSQCRTRNRVPAAKLNIEPKCGRCGSPLDFRHIDSGRPLTVNDGDFEQTVVRSPLPVLLYGWAPWCNICSGVDSTVNQLAYETKGRLRVAKLNIQTNPRLASEYNIMSVPSFFIFDGGKLCHHIAGAVPKHELQSQVARFLV